MAAEHSSGALVNSKDTTAPATNFIDHLINDDLVLVILDFVDVRQVLAKISRTSQRLGSISR